MGTSRWLVSATLLLGACDLLWAPFQSPNPAFCDPASPGCTNTNPDGAADAAVAMNDSDAGVGDMASPPDSALVDLGTNPDLLCSPSTAYPWVADPIPPGANNVNLTGITGNGSGDVWTVGNPSYAAHRKAAWTQIGTSGIASFGRAAYGPKQGSALALGSDGFTNSLVVHLTTGNTATTDTADLLTGVPSGIWVSGGNENLPYIVMTNDAFMYDNNGIWFDVDIIYGPTPAVLSDLSGRGSLNSTVIWGISPAAKKLAAYTTSANRWASVTTNASVLSAVWVSPNNGVVLAGKGGAIMNTPATLPPQSPVTMNSPVTADLSDVLGTADGKHLWAVGAGGTIVHFDSACGMWVQESSPTIKDLSALWVSDAEKTVWAVGNNGTVLHRTIP